MTAVLSCISGWTRSTRWPRVKALVDRADAATTFDELREAGEEFSKVMGRTSRESW